ncbi:Uma2 family endonuclease [Laspinema sp. D1]|uniref:Uma2 family endonuclease n=1 Tax=Laspinema palackyanum TaxID=3231601 RepID=UPI0034878F33|nr:Uma2 family endonuclease [Laspinema sp. D2b]
MAQIFPHQENPVTYPSEDWHFLARTYDHIYAIFITLDLLRQYLTGRQVTVLSKQFIYYSEGFHQIRLAPDVMVIFNVEPGERDNYKLWEEGEVPSVIFEMTSWANRGYNLEFKKVIYGQLEVEEYWVFDPKGECIPEKLQVYRLNKQLVYEPIADNYSTVLELRLAVEDKLIAFYGGDTGERLLMPDELRVAWQQERDRAEALAAQLRGLGVEPEA